LVKVFKDLSRGKHKFASTTIIPFVSTPETNNNLRHIFLAEDDIDDQEFLIEAFRSLDEKIKVHVENSGERAITYLESLDSDRQPSLIVLDYNLPQVSGYEILQRLEQGGRYRHVIKVVWSTSNSPLYEKACLEAGASAYFVKPSDVAGIRKLAEKMLRFCTAEPKLRG
jgi:CheY-like chemotaxis protein